MSKTAEAKKIILKYLEDGKIHSAKEIKEYVIKHSESKMTEGILAGCLKTLTTSGVIENIERGEYRLNNDVLEESKENKDENKEELLFCSRLQSLTENYKKEAFELINQIEITEANMEEIMLGMAIRKHIEEFSDKLQELSRKDGFNE